MFSKRVLISLKNEQNHNEILENYDIYLIYYLNNNIMRLLKKFILNQTTFRSIYNQFIDLYEICSQLIQNAINL